MLIDGYITYITTVRRYSPRTCAIYRDSLELFRTYLETHGLLTDAAAETANRTETETANQIETETTNRTEAETTNQTETPTADTVLTDCLTRSIIRSYEVWLLEERELIPRTVNLHLSVLSGFCSYLVRRGILQGNPVRTVTRPKEEKRLPEFYRPSSIDAYFRLTDPLVAEDLIYRSPDPALDKKRYEQRLGRLIISLLFNTGIRRSELISLKIKDVDFSRNVLKVLGKGDKMREIPLVAPLCKEISLYLRAVEEMLGTDTAPASPLLVTPSGAKLYPVYVDRAVKRELGRIGTITGRRSPHVLRHTLATELLNGGTDLNSIKQLLGHSSLAATQVYTHNSIAKLKKVYESAHPRAKKDQKNGD